MNGESTYQPNFVINEEDNISPEKKEFEDNIKSIPISSVSKQETANKLITREVKLIEAQRKKLRIFDPKGVYFYRHIAINYFQSAFHLITLLFSSCLIFLLIVFGYSKSQTLVQGIGWVSNTTLIENITYLVILIVLFIQLRGLFKLQGLNGLKRYKLAMLANSINNVVILHFKLIVLFLILMILYSFSLGSLVQADAKFEKLSNGVVADVFKALLHVVSIVIIVRSFRFCNKELAE